MDSLDWDGRVVEPQVLDTHAIASDLPEGPRLLTRNLTGVQPSQTQDLKFINLSHPDDLNRQQEVRTEIRRHVMKEIGQRRRRPRPKKMLTAARTPLESNNIKTPQLCMPDIDRFSSSQCLDMLAHFPVEADTRSFELMHFLVNAPYQPLKNIWIEIALGDSGAFHVTLGNAAHALNQITTNSIVKGPEALSHYEASTRTLRHRLNSSTASISEGVIANILGHVCLAIRDYDWDSLSVHMNGLSLIANLRGGFADLGYQMALLILLYDLTGAMVFDSFPRFDLPLQLVGTFDRPSRPPAPRLQGLLDQPMSPTFLPAGQALKMVSSIADIININSRRSSFWERDTDAIRLIGPCIHFLLSIPRLPSEYMAMTYPEDLIAREMVRLTCLMLMSKLKELFKFPPSEQVSLHARLVEFFSQNMKRLGKKYKELKTWALITITLLQYHTGEDIYLREMEREISEIDQRTPSELTDITRDIIWIDILMSPFSEDLLAEMTLRAVPLGAC